ncbi:MAG: Omp28 family outer membrane lipoprotein [Bacteroidia bacterium]
MKQYFFFLSVLCLVCFSACDIIEAPFTENNTSQVSEKKVLLEEFTGFHCPNCPDGAKKIEELSGKYGKNLIVISIHAGDFARPYPASANKFTTDFRTTAGNTLNATFSSGAYPSAVINRVTPKTEVLDKWSTIVDTLLKSPKEVKLTMTSNYADSIAEIKVDVEYLKAIAANKERLAIYMTEDSIVDWQLDLTQTYPNYPNGELPNYVHRHVLRGDIADGAWGRYLDENAATLPVGATYSKTYSYSFKGKKYNIAHCHAIAFVYDENTKRIREAQEIHIKE